MATFTAGNFDVDMDDLDLSVLLEGEIIAANQTSFAVRTTYGTVVTFLGQGFTYNSLFTPTGGVVTRVTETLNGAMVYDLTGASVPATTIVQWALTGDMTTALNTVFGGADLILGGPGGDLLGALGGNDSISGAGGDDSLLGGYGADTISGGLGNDVIADEGGFNYLRGNEGDDILVGGADFDDVHGNMGNDTVGGGGGADWVVGGQGNDMQFGGDGFDVVYGNLGSDSLSGDAGDDWVRGGQDNDRLLGGAGDDWLSGDRHNDTLEGGLGADLFNLFTNSGADRIEDFSLAQGDKIRWEGGLPSFTITQVGQDAVITYGADQVTLVGVSAASLTGSGWYVVA